MLVLCYRSMPGSRSTDLIDPQKDIGAVPGEDQIRVVNNASINLRYDRVQCITGNKSCGPRKRNGGMCQVTNVCVVVVACRDCLCSYHKY